MEVAGPAAEGVYLTFAKAPDTPEREQFVKTYKAMWDAKAVGSYAYYAYDAGMMVLSAINKIGTTKGDALQKEIRANTWSGVTGDIKFDAHGDRKLAHIIWVVKNGQFVPYWDPLTGKDL